MWLLHIDAADRHGHLNYPPNTAARQLLRKNLQELAYTLPEDKSCKYKGKFQDNGGGPPLKFQGHGGGPPLNKARIDQGQDAASAAGGSTFKNNGAHKSFEAYLLEQAKDFKQMQAYFYSILSN